MQRCTPGTSASLCLATQLSQFCPGTSPYFPHYDMSTVFISIALSLHSYEFEKRKPVHQIVKILFRKVHAMPLSAPKRHTQMTGDISEQAAITRLLQCGYVVLQPIGQMHRYDLVIEDASSSKCTLRIAPSKNKQEKNIRWAKDYEL